MLLQVSLTSCEMDNDIKPIEQVFPLQVGNEWVYEVTDYDTNGNALTVSSYKNTVRKDTTINSSTWYILSTGQIVQNSHEGYVYYNKAGNQAVMLYQSPSVGSIGYLYKYPDYDLLVQTTRSEQPDTVVTATKTFSSYVYTIEKQYTSHFDGATHTLKQKDYVSPGTGLVRTEKFYADSDKVMQRHVLVHYRLK